MVVVVVAVMVVVVVVAMAVTCTDVLAVKSGEASKWLVVGREAPAHPPPKPKARPRRRAI